MRYAPSQHGATRASDLRHSRHDRPIYHANREGCQVPRALGKVLPEGRSGTILWGVSGAMHTAKESYAGYLMTCLTPPHGKTSSTTSTSARRLNAACAMLKPGVLLSRTRPSDGWPKWLGE